MLAAHQVCKFYTSFPCSAWECQGVDFIFSNKYFLPDVFHGAGDDFDAIKIAFTLMNNIIGDRYLFLNFKYYFKI
ncbi:hypothetical protein ACM5Q9_03270 [Advenella sp. RU8]|uniref:hypothetical protein n=1 Tax=Advenella sp. RU8 TaxID=3399575 RepID=UPI003AABD8BB